MIHRFVSFYMDNVNYEVVKLQKEVFKKFDIELEQFQFTKSHCAAIEDFLNSDEKYDIITILDVDCIPFCKSFLEKIYFNLKDDNTIYGNAQSSNTYSHNIHKSPPFVAPSFLNFKKNLFETSNYKKFNFTWYPNPDGVNVEADVAEVFTRENEKQGRKIKLAYPIKCHTKEEWKYDGSHGFKAFSFGVATEFESGMYHNFQVRFPVEQDRFVNYCRKVLFENYHPKYSKLP